MNIIVFMVVGKISGVFHRPRTDSSRSSYYLYLAPIYAVTFNFNLS